MESFKSCLIVQSLYLVFFSDTPDVVTRGNHEDRLASYHFQLGPGLIRKQFAQVFFRMPS